MQKQHLDSHFDTAGSMLLLIGLIPGLPKFPVLLLSSLLLGSGYMMTQAEKKREMQEIEAMGEKASQEKRKSENISSYLSVDPIELEFGYNIIPLVDSNQGGDLLDRVIAIRKQCALELGLIVPVIRLRDNMQLDPNTYVIKIKGTEVAEGQVLWDHYLVMKNDETAPDIEGIDTVEPAFGLPAKWIKDDKKEDAELSGYTVIDSSAVMATHLTEVLKRYGHELMGRQQVQNLIDGIKETQPALIEDVVPKVVSLGEIQKVLANLLREGVPIRDMTTILETLGDYGQITKDTDMLTEYVRQNMSRTITRRFINNNNAIVITLDPEVEQLILNNIQQTKQGSYVSIEPDKLRAILSNLKNAVEKFNSMGLPSIVVTSPVVRFHFKRMTQQLVSDLVVLSYNEIEPDVQIHSSEQVTMDN